MAKGIESKGKFKVLAKSEPYMKKDTNEWQNWVKLFDTNLEEMFNVNLDTATYNMLEVNSEIELNVQYNIFAGKIAGIKIINFL